MADSETSVLYKAIADFSQLISKAAEAKAAIAALREEEAKLNAESAAGSTKAAAAHTASTTSANNETAAVEKGTTARVKKTKATTEGTTATEKGTAAVKNAVLSDQDATAAKDKYRAALDKHAIATGKSIAANDAALSSTEKITAATVKAWEAEAANLAALDKHTAAEKTHAESVLKAAEAHKKSTDYVGKHTESLSFLDRVVSSMKRTFSDLTGALDGSTAAHGRHRVASDSNGSAMSRLMANAKSLGSGLDSLGSKIQKIPSMVPLFAGIAGIIPSIVAMIGPLISGISALGGGIIGLASNIGSLSGAGFAALPGLTALLSAFGAMKIAISGIPAAFKAFGSIQRQAGLSAAGGGTPPPAAAISQSESIARANETLRRSVEGVKFASDDLDAARVGYTQRVDTLRKAVERAAASEAAASANVQLAKENYANVMADPSSTKGQKMEAAAHLTDTQNTATDVLAQDKQNAADLKKLQDTGMEGDKQVVMAKRAVTDAVNSERDAQIALENAQRTQVKAASAATTAANAYKAAMDKLSPSAQEVVRTLTGMNDQWIIMKKTIQESFFSKIVGDVKNLSLLIEPLTSLLSNTAGAVGSVVSNLLKMVLTQQWRDDIKTIGQNNIPIIQNLGAALGSVMTAFKDLTIAASPFTILLSEGLKTGADNFAKIVATARDNGKLAAWLDVVHGRMQQWWTIIKDLGVTIFNFGKAAGDFGQWMVDGIEKMVKGWKDYSAGAVADGSPFKKWLEDIKPLLSSLSGLAHDFFSWWARTSADPKNISGFTSMVTVLRDELGPALSRIIDALSSAGSGSGFLSTISSILAAFATFLENGGAEAMGTFGKVIAGLALSLADILSHTPAPVITALATAFGVMAALKFTHILDLLGMILKVGTSAQVANFFAGGGLRTLFEGPKASEVTKAARLAETAAKDAPGLIPLAAKPVAKAVEKNVAEDVAVGAGESAAGGGIMNWIRRLLPFGKGAGAGAAEVAAGAGAEAAGGAGVLAGAAGLGAKVLKASPFALAATAGSWASDKFINDHQGGAREVGGSVLSGALGGAAIGATVGSIIPGVGTGIGAGVGAAIGGAKAALDMDPDKVYKAGQELKKTWDGITKTVSEWFSSLGSNIAGWAGDVWNGVKDVGGWLSNQWDNLTKWFSDLPGQIATWAGDLWAGIQGIPEWLGAQWDNVETWLSELPGKIGDIAGTSAGQWWNAVKGVGEWLKTQWDNISAWFAALPGQIASWASGIWNGMQSIGQWLAGVWSTIFGWFAALPGRIASVATTIWNGMQSIGQWLGGVWASFVGWLGALPGRIASGARTIWNGMQNIGPWLSGVWGSISSWLSQLPQRIGQAASNLWGFMGGIGGWIQEQNSAVWRWITQLPGNILKWVQSIGGWFASVFGTFMSHFSSSFDATQHHNGGVITRAEGGDVPGGTVPGSGNADTVPALLTPGEFVLRKSIASQIGLDNLYALNSGAISYAQMLQNAYSPTSRPKGNGAPSPQFFDTGGRVSAPQRFTIGGPVAPGSTSSSSGNITVENLVVNNPLPETASDSLPRSIRKLAYLGSH